MLFRISLLTIVLVLSSCKEKGSSSPSKEPNDSKARIVFFGDSLTAGYGLANEDFAWPNLVVKALQEEGYPLQITNAGLSGDTTSGGLGRLEWVLSQKPDYFVIELGANDMLRGIEPDITKKNLTQIIQRIQKTEPNCKILLVGMLSTPNMGKGFRKKFDSIYSDLAKEFSLPLIPFLLIDVFGDRSLNQKDGIHPTEEGHERIAKTVLPYIKKLVEKSK